MIAESWLEAFNKKSSDEGVPYRTRPFLALRAWSIEHSVSISLTSDMAKHVFDWFQRNSAPQSHAIGALFTGIFFYDVYFWPINIPIAYGTVSLEPFVALRNMPESVISRLRNESIARLAFLGCWADCVDYGFGRDDLQKNRKLSSFAEQLFTAADAQIDATVALLLEHRPNSKAMDCARMATEIVLKAFLATHDALTERGAKGIGHDLTSALDACIRANPNTELAVLSGSISAFPPIESRYQGTSFTLDQLWSAYATAQFAASAFVRSVTDRNMRRTIEVQLQRSTPTS